MSRRFKKGLQVVTILLSLVTAAVAAPKHYQRLEEATADMDRILTANGREKLVELMAPAKGDETSFAKLPATYDVLRLQWKEAGPFAKLYAGRDFPAAENSFTLGGHEKELGHVNIQFSKDAEGWVLKDIWVCR